MTMATLRMETAGETCVRLRCATFLFVKSQFLTEWQSNSKDVRLRTPPNLNVFPDGRNRSQSDSRRECAPLFDQVVDDLYEIEHQAPDDYKGPSKYEQEFIIGPLANAGLSKMHEAMHTALHHHMGRGHKDRHCCGPNFDPGIRMRARPIRDSLVYGTRKYRTKGLKVDESIRMYQPKYRSKKIRDSLVYGTRTKRCRHKHCTAFHHEHEWNTELEWDIPLSMLKNEKRKTLWFEARQSVLDQERLRRRSIPKTWYGEVETDGGYYCGYNLREVILKPWHEGAHTHDFYCNTRDIRPDDWMWEPDWYDPEPEKIEYHKRKIKELWNWFRRRNLLGDMMRMFLRIAEVRRQRRHFQRLKLRLKKKELLWSELNRNSLWFNPWPEGDQMPVLVRRSLMAISKRLSTCAPMWDPMFVDFPTCEFYLNHLDELRPEVWDRFHYNCKKHTHKDLFERRETLRALMAAADAPAPEEKVMLPPLCGPVQALEDYREQWAEVKQVWEEILASRPPPPPPKIEDVTEEHAEDRRKGKKTVEFAADKTATKEKKGTDDAKDKKAKHPAGIEDHETKPAAKSIAQDKRDTAAHDTATTTKKGILSSSHPKAESAPPQAHSDGKKMVEATAVKAPNTKRKKSVKFAAPPLPPQVTFMKKGEGRQSMSKPPPTEEELKALQRLNPPEPEEESTPESVVEYVPFKFPIRKRRVRWSIIGGKVPILPPPAAKPPLSKESQTAALDVLDLDKFEAKLEGLHAKADGKKEKGAAKDKKGAAKADDKKKDAKKK
ncbi:hypothetical protein R1sor_016247 [Riccia sorocarpa]|uniref:Uncharacterized protein n=1 Tax=Riccia sorocarpa TaxID=122646 RepID=A0ABD3HEV6_9MARC